MAGMIQVTPSALRNKAGELRAQNKLLRTYIESMRNQEQGLRGMWEGEAHDIFAREFMKDAGKMDEFCAAIDTFAASLEEIASEYERAENTNTMTATVRYV